MWVRSLDESQRVNTVMCGQFRIHVFVSVCDGTLGSARHGGRRYRARARVRPTQNLARFRRKMAGLHDIRDVIEPASGAARKASDGNRGGVHTMWQSGEYRNVWWCVPSTVSP